jgi:hypothetical protein
MNRPQCRTCIHWLHMYRGEEAPDGEREGRCLRYPPVISNVSADGTKMIQDWQQPHTLEWETCGEHSAFPAYIAGLAEEKRAKPPKRIPDPA